MFERANHKAAYYDISRFERLYRILPAVNHVAEYPATCKAFPPRQEAGSFNPNKVLETL